MPSLPGVAGVTHGRDGFTNNEMPTAAEQRVWNEGNELLRRADKARQGMKNLSRERLQWIADHSTDVNELTGAWLEISERDRANKSKGKKR